MHCFFILRYETIALIIYSVFALCFSTTIQYSHKTMDSNWVKLNVGGQVFLTTRSTLLRDPKSFLYRLIDEDGNLPSDKDENGAFLIDRDPRYFHIVLNYLRHGKLIVDSNLTDEGVLEEAEFYNITALIHLIREKTKDAERQKLLANDKTVYRVIQCSEEELTRLISALSDGWKFEQLVPIGSNYSYGNDDRTEYLCVVSKVCPPVKNDIGPANGMESSDRAKLLQEMGSRT